MHWFRSASPENLFDLREFTVFNSVSTLWPLLPRSGTVRGKFVDIGKTHLFKLYDENNILICIKTCPPFSVTTDNCIRHYCLGSSSRASSTGKPPRPNPNRSRADDVRASLETDSSQLCRRLEDKIEHLLKMGDNLTKENRGTT